jgi:hypothetical protein
MYFNLSRDLLGIDPREGTTFQTSSFGKRTKVAPGVAGRFQEKCLDLAPGEPFTMADLDGPGVITRIWVTMPRKINPGVCRNVVLKAWFDDEDGPSVQTPLGDLFGTTFARPRQYASAYTAITSGAYLCFFPMPFRRKAVITLENQGRFPVRLFFYQVTWLRLERELPQDTPYFHCSWHRERCSRNGAPYTVLDARGRGFYLGCHLDMQGKGWPWHPNPARISMPEGYGMGVLEGWETMRIDGAALPNVHGTGGEDYFNGAWYFTRVPSTWLTHGVTERRYDTRRVSCYRFHVEMPVCFRESIAVTIDHGLDNLLPADIDGTTYWYQEEPHVPFAPLPPAKERQPVPTAANRLIMAAPLAATAAAVYGVHRKIKAKSLQG